MATRSRDELGEDDIAKTRLKLGSSSTDSSLTSLINSALKLNKQKKGINLKVVNLLANL